MDDSKTLQSIDAKLSAITALLAVAITNRVGEEKPEVILHANGLDVPTIANILGKKEPAVRKVLQRSGKK